jgi:hypothetical protein
MDQQQDGDGGGQRQGHGMIDRKILSCDLAHLADALEQTAQLIRDGELVPQGINVQVNGSVNDYREIWFSVRVTDVKWGS